MLDFQQGRKPRNFLSRREQWRLLLLVLTLGLIVILMFEARKPEHYSWFCAAGEDGAGGGTTGKPSSDSRPTDPRLQSPSPDEGLPGMSVSPSLVKSAEAAPSRYFPGVKPSYLETIQDNRPFRRAEWDAWLHLLDILGRTDEATLTIASTGPVSFVQLFQQSEEYRGELVTTRGTIRRAHRLKAPKNEYGIDDYYQTWLQPADHPEDPMVVYCLHLPNGFPTGMDVSADVAITGFYFKLSVYKAQDAVRRAPMLLSRTVHWQKKPEVVKKPDQGSLFTLLMIAGSAAFAVLATAYVYYRTRGAGAS